jgi:hypothetical protein
MFYLSLPALIADIRYFSNRICVPDWRSKQNKNSIGEIQASDAGQVEPGTPKRQQPVADRERHFFRGHSGSSLRSSP